MQKFTFSALFITDEDDESADKNSLCLHSLPRTKMRAQIRIDFLSTLFITDDDEIADKN